jgi:hypothetical protein
MTADLFKFLSCYCIRRGYNSRLSEKHLITNPSHYTAHQDHPSSAELANQIVAKLLAAHKNDAVLRADLKSTIHTYS